MPYAWPDRDPAEGEEEFRTRLADFGPVCAADVVVPALTDKEVHVAIAKHNADVVREGSEEGAAAEVDEQVATLIKQHDQLHKCFGGKRFRLRVLDEHSLDGIIQSNDEMYSFTQSGKRDGTIFNMVIQGPAMTNNGYNCYDGGYMDNETGRHGHYNPDNQFLEDAPVNPGPFRTPMPAPPANAVPDEVRRSDYGKGDQAGYEAAVAARDALLQQWNSHYVRRAAYDLERAQHARKLKK